MAPARVLLVFGRGVVRTGDAWELTPSSVARVDAVVRYVAAQASPGEIRPRVIFSGGWPEASEGAAAPPAGAREGALMLRAARAAGLHEHADLYAETRSRSTLENLLHTVEDGLLAGQVFGPSHPLGLVSHAWHLPRVRFLAGRVLRLRGAALVDVPATGGEEHGDRGLLLAARFGFLCARRGAALLRRERRMVAVAHLVRKLSRRP
ncbi:ElyC/SanA/YdcF family protein [Actinoplanes sp. NPDC049668]|uniref:ElyC/SanA/YdcF family protein n=1 Tax=unclassified Actinoplanes TaxID=2626549 RepID=UPI0033A579CC